MRQAPEISGKGINSVRGPIPGGYLRHFSRYDSARDEMNDSKPEGRDEISSHDSQLVCR